MKVLFLDIDGVLNTYGSSGSSVSWEHCKKDLMHNLERIIEETGAKIVISSSWREEGIELLKENGFKHVDSIIGVVPLFDKDHKYIETRGEKILEWLKENEVEAYVVVDDEVFDICGDKCKAIPKENVVATNPTEGLTKEKADEVINIFLGKSIDKAHGNFAEAYLE